MTIRYKCDSCGSTLNIKEELAGTAGKCPKCKAAFTVPQPKSTAPDQSSKIAKPARQKKKSTRSKPGKSRRKDDDFDPMAVLMGGEQTDAPVAPAGPRKPAPPPLSDEELPADLDLELSFDEDAEEPPVKKAKKRKRVQFDSDDEMDVNLSASAAATAGGMLSDGASAGAKDLLTKTMEESRARSSRMDEEDTRPQGPTIQDYLREFGPKGAAIAAGSVILIVGVYYLAKGMYGGGMDLPELGEVYGTVKLDGKPLPGAKVMFTPLDKSLTVKGKENARFRTSTAKTDEEGYYELIYTEGVLGAAVTEHKVSIMKYGSDGMLLTPIAYSQYSEESRTVESGSQEFDFALESDPEPDPPKNRR